MEKWFPLLSVIACVLVILRSSVQAETLNSTNYQLLDPELLSSSGNSSSSNYKQLISAGGGITYGQVSSTLYSIGSGQGYTFMANVPKVKCLETKTTSITTQCTTSTDTFCGTYGCYDRARVEIDTQSNPIDTVYSIQISPDNFTSVYIIDGVTRMPKSVNTKTISDYLTATAWEGGGWNSDNIRGLYPGIQYSLRIVALQGDFTETPPGPSQSVTTMYPTASLDIDIGTSFAAENAPPYAIRLKALAPETATFSTEYIKIDYSTNARNGASLYVADLYNGLRSPSLNTTLSSTTEDLSLPASNDGFGIQFVNAQTESGSLGKAVSRSPYNGGGSQVGAVQSSVATAIGCSITSILDTCSSGTPSWITNGSLQFRVGARSTLSNRAASDYTDTLQFTLVGNW